MSEIRNREFIEIHEWEELPDFQSEAEEAEFWSTHSLGEELLEQMQPIPSGVLPPHRKETMKLQLLEIINGLPDDLLAEVRDFVEFLQEKYHRKVG